MFKLYLRLLGIKPLKPGMKALGEIISAQLARVPFENISKLYYFKHEKLRTLPGLERYLYNIEHYNFGGTCYTNNYYLYLLLKYLGYEIRLCGADMSRPDVHIICMVRIENLEYIVDIGYAAPFCEPLPRFLETDHTIINGRDKYVFKPQNKNGQTRLELYRDNSLLHGYVAKPEPRIIEEFSKAIKDSFHREATFRNSFLLTKFTDGQSLVINNLKIIKSRGCEYKARPIQDLKEFVLRVEEYFGIPGKFTSDVLDQVGELDSSWG